MHRAYWWKHWFTLWRGVTACLLFFSFLFFLPFRQSFLFVLVHCKERRGWLASKSAERNSEKGEGFEIDAWLYSLSLSLSFLPFTLFVSSARRKEHEAAPFFLPFRPSKHDTTPLGDPPHVKESTHSIPVWSHRDRLHSTRPLVSLFSLPRHFALANRRSILASMRRSRAPTSFPIVRFFLAKDTYTELLSTLVSNFSTGFHAFALIQKKITSLSLSFHVSFFLFFTAKI